MGKKVTEVNKYKKIQLFSHKLQYLDVVSLIINTSEENAAKIHDILHWNKVHLSERASGVPRRPSQVSGRMRLERKGNGGIKRDREWK